jgi:hypothetical protein
MELPSEWNHATSEAETASESGFSQYSPKRLENVASTILEAATEDEYSGIFLEVCRELAETH